MPKEQPLGADAGDEVTEQQDGVCPQPSSLLVGTKQAGEACAGGSDCAPTCCPCNNGTNRSYLAVHCRDKVCAGANDACTVSAADFASLCNVQ